MHAAAFLCASLLNDGVTVEPDGRPTYAHRAEYVGLRSLTGLLRAMPVEAASDLMGGIWRRTAPRTRRHARVLQNLAIALPSLSARERGDLARRQWENLGRVFAESFHLDRILADGRVTLHDPEGLVSRWSGERRGCVFVSLHSGNWEVVGAPVQDHWTSMALYQPLKNPLADAEVRAHRRHVFPGGLHGKGHASARTALRWVRDGGALSLLADHREARGEPVAFFGVPTTATPFPAMVARRLGVPLIAGRSRREGPVRYRIEVEDVTVARTDDASADVRTTTQRIQTLFERWIREEPGSYMWVHDRWKHLPEERRRELLALANEPRG